MPAAVPLNAGDVASIVVRSGSIQRASDNATPGDYEMVMNFRDELSGKTLELREPFSVVPPPSASGDTNEETSADLR